jgi:hypothetical protein
VTITGGVFACNAIDLDYETADIDGLLPPSFEGSTGWQCSNPDSSDCTVLGECKAVTTGLEAPQLDPPTP